MTKDILLFDLDGTLLPMDQDRFIQTYFHALATWMAPYGFEEEKLIPAIWQAIKAITHNQTNKSNEDVFWENFQTMFTFPVLDYYDQFLEFYEKGFVVAKKETSCNPKANALIQKLKEEGYQMALATNPFFPRIATKQRIEWAGLNLDDFLFYTTYEDSYSCKPNVSYYEEVAKRCGVSPSQCRMIGNDVEEDGIAQKSGMKVFLLTDCLLNPNQVDINSIPHGSYEELERWILA